jgi:autoinducer 2-degrading protein
MIAAASHPAHVVLVEFVVMNEYSADFLQLVLHNAASSLASEPGCRVFDVCRTQEDPDRFLLYEVYDDAEAFQRHLKTSHFAEFNRQTEACILAKTVRVFSRLNASSPCGLPHSAT